MSNSLDPDQARRIVGPDLGPNCLPRLSADVTGRQRVKFPKTWRLEVVSQMRPCILTPNIQKGQSSEENKNEARNELINRLSEFHFWFVLIFCLNGGHPSGRDGFSLQLCQV